MNESYMNESYLTGHPVVIGYPVPSSRFLTWMNNGIPVITAPEAGVDIANYDALRRKLLAAAAYSPVVIVDGSDSAFAIEGLRVLDEVGRMMEEAGGELRVVLSSSRRIYHLQVARCHRHVRTYLNLFEALLTPGRAGASQPMAA
jgi:hypothetical protein